LLFGISFFSTPPDLQRSPCPSPSSPLALQTFGFFSGLMWLLRKWKLCPLEVKLFFSSVLASKVSRCGDPRFRLLASRFWFIYRLSSCVCLPNDFRHFSTTTLLRTVYPACCSPFLRIFYPGLRLFLSHIICPNDEVSSILTVVPFSSIYSLFSPTFSSGGRIWVHVPYVAPKWFRPPLTLQFRPDPQCYTPRIFPMVRTAPVRYCRGRHFFSLTTLFPYSLLIPFPLFFCWGLGGAVLTSGRRLAVVPSVGTIQAPSPSTRFSRVFVRAEF